MENTTRCFLHFGNYQCFSHKIIPFTLLIIWHISSTGTSTNSSTICQISSTSMLAVLAQYSISAIISSFVHKKFATHWLTHSPTPLLEPLAVQAPPGLKWAQSFPWATSKLFPPLTLGTLCQIHKVFQGSGNGLRLAMTCANKNWNVVRYCTISLWRVLLTLEYYK